MLCVVCSCTKIENTSRAARLLFYWQDQADAWYAQWTICNGFDRINIYCIFSCEIHIDALKNMLCDGCFFLKKMIFLCLLSTSTNDLVIWSRWQSWIGRVVGNKDMYLGTFSKKDLYLTVGFVFWIDKCVVSRAFWGKGTCRRASCLLLRTNVRFEIYSFEKKSMHSRL